MSRPLQLTFIEEGNPLPDPSAVSAVFLIGFCADRVVAARNERGWDIPGGHVEFGETLLDALSREVAEEAGATFEEGTPLAVLSPAGGGKVMLVYAAADCRLHDFVPKPDCLERALLAPAQLVSRYYGDQDLLRELIDRAQARLNE